MTNMKRLMSKYRAIRTKVDNVSFASKREANVYLGFKGLLKLGKIKELKLQPRFKFPCGVTYVADFDILWKNGDREIVDVKGFLTSVYRIKKKMFKYHYPNLKFTEVK